MCLILFAYQQHPEFALILIANRDEYYARPTRDAHWWDDAEIFAGRDLEAGGTWLGINRQGHIAAVTNVREPGGMRAGKKSRGDLTRDYLAANEQPEDYLQRLARRDQDFAGFNLLLGNPAGLWFYSNRNHGIRQVEPGVYGISNGGFDEPWPKLSSGKAELENLINDDIDTAELMEILTDHQIAQDHELPSTGVPLDFERLLSSRFIRSSEYGTRACSVVTIETNNRINFKEQNYPDAQHRGKLIEESFELTQ